MIINKKLSGMDKGAAFHFIKKICEAHLEYCKIHKLLNNKEYAQIKKLCQDIPEYSIEKIETTYYDVEYTSKPEKANFSNMKIEDFIGEKFNRIKSLEDYGWELVKLSENCKLLVRITVDTENPRLANICKIPVFENSPTLLGDIILFRNSLSSFDLCYIDGKRPSGSGTFFLPITSHPEKMVVIPEGDEISVYMENVASPIKLPLAELPIDTGSVYYTLLSNIEKFPPLRDMLIESPEQIFRIELKNKSNIFAKENKKILKKCLKIIKEGFKAKAMECKTDEEQTKCQADVIKFLDDFHKNKKQSAKSNKLESKNKKSLKKTIEKIK